MMRVRMGPVGPKRVLLVVATALLLAGVAASPAASQGSIEPTDSATGWDHVNDPPPDAFSSAEWCFSFGDPSLVGETIEVATDGPTGPLVGTGVVQDNGAVRVRVGITEGGPYTVTSAQVVGGAAVMVGPGVAALDVIFDPGFQDCLAGLELATLAVATEVPLPPPTPTTGPTALPEATTAPTAVPTAVPTTAPTAVPTVAPTAAPTTAPGTVDGGGSGAGPWIGVGVAGLFLAGAGIFLIAKARQGEDCEKEKKAWDAAEASYSDSVDAVPPAQQDVSDTLETRKKAARDLRRAQADIPPEPGGDSVTDERTGETVTSRDRWMRERYAAAEGAAYRSNPNPTTARAFEDAMRTADTPEARQERRQAAEQARARAVPLQAALDAAQQAEREAESALERRHRDVASDRRFADEAKKRYEDCIKEQAAFDAEAEKARQKYEDAVERDRRRREAGGDGPGGTPPAVAPPPAPEVGGPCSPIGSTTQRTSRFNGRVIADNDTVTFTLFRSHGAFEDDELGADSTDPLFAMFGVGAGADTRTATFTMPAQAASLMNPNAIVANFDAHQQKVARDLDATGSRQIDLTISWGHRTVRATCTRELRCMGDGWKSTGPGSFSEQPSPLNTATATVTLGTDEPANELTRIFRTLQSDVRRRRELFDFQEQCDRA